MQIRAGSILHLTFDPSPVECAVFTVLTAAEHVLVGRQSHRTQTPNVLTQYICYPLTILLPSNLYSWRSNIVITLSYIYTCSFTVALHVNAHIRCTYIHNLHCKVSEYVLMYTHQVYIKVPWVLCCGNSDIHTVTSP